MSRGVKVVTAYGGTEMGLLVKATIDPENWSYAEFSDKCKIRWIPQGDGTFEAQFLVRIFPTMRCIYIHCSDLP